MKKFSFIVLGLIALLVVAVLVAPAFIDWNRFKPQIAEVVRSSTGRDLRIDGDLKISLLPSLRVSAGDIRLSNAAGMTAPDMVSIGSVALEAQLWPLLSKRLVVNSLVVKDPSINLEVDKSGHPNWALVPAGGTGGTAAAPEAGGSGPLSGVQLGDVRIEQGRLSYLSAASGQTIEAKGVNLTAEMADLSKPLLIRGQMTLNDEPVSTNVTVDSLSRLSQSQQATVKLAIDTKHLQVHYDGAAQQQPVPGLDGTFDLDIASVGQLLAWLHMPLDAKQPDPGPLNAHAVLTAEGSKLALKDATITGTALKAHASGSLDASGSVTKASLDVESDVLDVDRYLPPQAAQQTRAEPQTRQPGPPANVFAALSDKPLDLKALRGTDADIKVAIAGIKALGYEVGRIAFTTKAKAGVVDADLTELALYGGNASGSVKLDASGDALGLKTAMKIDHVTVDKLARAATGDAAVSGVVSATLDADARGASPRALAESLSAKVALDLGGVNVKQGAHGVSGLKLNIDLPGPDKPALLKASLVYNGEPVTADATTGAVRTLLSGDRFPAKLAVSSKVVTFGYDGTVQQRPVPGLDGTFDLDIPSVGKLASWLDQPLDAKQPDPGPLKAHAVLTADGSKLALKDATITGKALKATAEGRFDASQKVAAFDANVDILQADLNAYLPPQTQKGAAAAPSGAKPQSTGWSTEPFEFAMLGQANGQARVHVAGTRYGELEATQGQLTATLSNGILKLSVEKLALAQGTITTAVVLDGSNPVAKLDYDVSVAGAQAKPLLKTFADSERLSGTIEFQTTGKGGGRNQKELIESLNGSGKFAIRDGAINGINLASTLRQVGSLGFKESTAEKTDFAELSGTYTIKNGVLDNRDMKMLAPLVRLTGSGTVPMPPKTIDYTVEAKLVATTEGQGGKDALAGLPIPIKVTGLWSDISYQIDWKSVFSEMAKNPEALKNLPANLGNAAKSYGVTLPGAGGGGGLQKVIPGLPTVPGTQPPSTSPQPTVPSIPSLPKGLFGG